MEGFVQHKGALWAIQGHVIMIRLGDMKELQEDFVRGFCLPWAFSEEDGLYQFSHPMNEKERAAHAWLYHRMEALKPKELDTDPQPPHNPGPQAA